ncbi:MAG TPA: NEW3 domain-containing protein, partial [Acidimicrobiia bacterium]|nr:NEW3 domain-containing protein [Acidimicrobiia bacterium]
EAVGGVTMTPEAQLLNGASDATFTFNLDIENDTPAEVTLELFAIGPEGWQVQAQPAGQRQASSVTVTAGGTSRITVTANSAVDTTAGDYELLVTASGGGHQLQVPLLVRITGTFDMTFITAEERLNAEVSAGNPSQLGLLVINTGTAPLRGVVLSATAPSGWEVAFTPVGIDAVEANATTEVVATITPAGNAIAGDYVISFRANVAEVQSSIEVRTTVNPSAVWGFVGIGAIAIALAALAWVFRRFGRR